MDYIGGLSSIISIVSFVIFAAGVMKVFQMATTLIEIKDLLTAIKLNAPIQPVGSAAGYPIASSIGVPAPLPSAPSGEEMLRAALSELDHPINPTSVELGNKS